VSINGPTSAEVRARLGLQPVNRPETMEERIERNFVTSMPEAEENDPASLLGTAYEER
jgi:hypothetical protein